MQFLLLSSLCDKKKQESARGNAINSTSYFLSLVLNSIAFPLEPPTETVDPGKEQLRYIANLLRDLPDLYRTLPPLEGGRVGREVDPG